MSHRVSPTSAPDRVDVLVLDAEFRQSLVCMRVLARRGLRVGAVACEAELWAPSFNSRWCSLRATVPGFADDEDSYVDELIRLIDAHKVDLIVPAHDGSIAALRKRRGDVERHTALPLASEHALDIAVSKERTLSLATELRVRVPRTITARDLADVSAAATELGVPVVVKPVESWASGAGKGERLRSVSAVSAAEAQRCAETIFAAGRHVLVQEWLPGCREAVSLFRSNGRCWAKFAQRSRREVPILGGASVFYESIAPQRELSNAAEALVDAIDLDGCSVVEFRRDQRGKPVLMEVNPRMAGSVGLAVSCGVDFPGMLRAWAMGEPLQATTTYDVGRRLRWLAGDIRSLRDNFAERGNPDAVPRARAVATFLSDFAVRPSSIDPVAWDDPRPAVSELRHVLTGFVGRRAKGFADRVARTGTGEVTT